MNNFWIGGVLLLAWLTHRVLFAAQGPILSPPPIERFAILSEKTNGSRPWAMVTAGSKGIGLGYAKALRRRGFSVLLTGTSETSAQAGVDQVLTIPCGGSSYSTSCEVEGTVLDISNTEDVKSKGLELFDSNDKDIRVLVLQAGIDLHFPIHRGTFEAMEMQLNSAHSNTILLAIATLSWTSNQEFGVVVGCNAITSFVDKAGAEPYNAHRSYLARLYQGVGAAMLSTSSAHANDATRQVLVALVDTGPVDTGLTQRMVQEQPELNSTLAWITRTPDDFAGVVLSRILDGGETIINTDKLWRLARFLHGLGVPISFGDQVLDQKSLIV